MKRETFVECIAALTLVVVAVCFFKLGYAYGVRSEWARDEARCQQLALIVKAENAEARKQYVDRVVNKASDKIADSIVKVVQEDMYSREPERTFKSILDSLSPVRDLMKGESDVEGSDRNLDSQESQGKADKGEDGRPVLGIPASRAGLR